MFGNRPWHPGLPPYWRLLVVPPLLIAALALVWLLQYGLLAASLAEWFLTPDGDTTLELPDDLVLARLPWSYAWNADPATDGVLVALAANGDPVGQPLVIERWSRPWKDGKREPIPAAWQVATPPEWQNDTALVCYFGFNSPVTRDRSLLAAQGPQTRILSLPDGRELARLKATPAATNGKCMAWHPTEKVLAIGSYGTVTLAAGPDWQARTLATASRDFHEWEVRVQAGQEETGYYPHENVSQLLFSDDGAWFLAAMDRGVRVYDWHEVRQATGRLPPPRRAVDGVLVKQPLFSAKMTFSVAHDARRGLVLWSENDGTLQYLRLATGERGTLLALSNRYRVSRVHLCAAGDGLVCEVVRLGKSGTSLGVLAVLDYPGLLRRAGVEPAPAAEAAGAE